MSYRSITIAFLLGQVIAHAQSSGTDPRFASYIVDPGKNEVSLHWKDAQGHVLGNIGNLQHDEAAHDRTLLLAMNGGMYTEAQATLGLYVEKAAPSRR